METNSLSKEKFKSEIIEIIKDCQIEGEASTFCKFENKFICYDIEDLCYNYNYNQIPENILEEFIEKEWMIEKILLSLREKKVSNLSNAQIKIREFSETDYKKREEYKNKLLVFAVVFSGVSLITALLIIINYLIDIQQITKDLIYKVAVAFGAAGLFTCLLGVVNQNTQKEKLEELKNKLKELGIYESAKEIKNLNKEIYGITRNMRGE